MRLGEILKTYRKVKGVTQSALASDIGISNTMLCRLEAGKTADYESILIILNWLSGSF